MRSILHIDMDAFYASVEQRDNPDYRDKPVVVGADPKEGRGRGVVSAASYKAREFGIHSAMPIRQAYWRCPSAVFLPVRMHRYQEVSKKIFEVFHRYTDLVEPLSLDEAFLDVTGSSALFGSAETIGRRIQEKIWKEEHLHASVGVASNKFLAKVASDLQKPQGFVIVPSGKEREFLHGLPISRLWGAGGKTTQVLLKAGYQDIGNIAQQPQSALRSLLGKSGSHLWQLANGFDDRPVVPNAPAKSIGAETTFAKDTASSSTIRQTVLELSERVAYRLRTEGVGARGVMLKYRDETFRTFTRSLVLSELTNQSSDLYRVALRLLERISPTEKKVRLLGLTVSKLEPFDSAQQLSLFVHAKNRTHSLASAVDSIRHRFGRTMIQPGSLVEKPKR
ncbi:MAG: DNA polymerase IV [Nitrospirales bacterium]